MPATLAGAVMTPRSKRQAISPASAEPAAVTATVRARAQAGRGLKRRTPDHSARFRLTAAPSCRLHWRNAPHARLAELQAHPGPHRRHGGADLRRRRRTRVRAPARRERADRPADPDLAGGLPQPIVHPAPADRPRAAAADPLCLDELPGRVWTEPALDPLRRRPAGRGGWADLL